jgi:branched-chain amino acid transport system permease protein
MLVARARSGTLPITLTLIALLGILGVLPLSPQFIFVLTLAMGWSIAVIGLDVFAGYIGQPSFGQAAFVGIGAYSVTILRVEFHVPAVASIIGALLISSAIATVVGMALVQLRHFGAALTTFFFAYIVVTMLDTPILDPITHSEAGISVPPLKLGDANFSEGLGLYYLTWVVLLVAAIVANNYVNGRLGRSLRLVKQSEIVASVLGVNVRQTRLAAFVFSSVLASLAGLPLSLAIGYLAPEVFGPHVSITLFAMMVVGGIGSVAGAILGAMFFGLLPQYLQVTRDTQAILFALIFLAFLVFLPVGIFGLFEKLAASAVRRLPSDRIAGLAKVVVRLRSIGRQGRPPTVIPSVLPPLKEGRTHKSERDTIPMLLTDKASVSFGGVTALSQVSLSVRGGEIHAIVGPNGAGKTTLLNAICGIQRLKSGSIVVKGRTVSQMTPPQIRKIGIARTFQHPALVPDLTVLENVKLGLFASYQWSVIRDLGGRFATRAVEEPVTSAALAALKRVRFPETRLPLLAGDLTLAEQKFVDIARAIAAGADLILLDEPTAGLGEQDIGDVAQLLIELRDEGNLTIIVIAHHVEFVMNVADVVTVLDFGRVIAEGPPNDVVNNPLVLEAFLGNAATVGTVLRGSTG